MSEYIPTQSTQSTQTMQSIQAMPSKFTFDLKARLFTFLVMMYTAIALCCDIIAFKMVNIGHDHALMAAAFLFPLLYVFTDVITELFGGKCARFAVLVHIACDLVFTFMILFFIHLNSPSWWHNQAAYNTVLDPMGRLYIAGVIGGILSAVVNIYYLSKWKLLTNGKYFWLRSSVSTAIAIFVYTVTDIKCLALSAVLNAIKSQVTV